MYARNLWRPIPLKTRA